MRVSQVVNIAGHRRDGHQMHWSRFVAWETWNAYVPKLDLPVFVATFRKNVYNDQKDTETFAGFKIITQLSFLCVLFTKYVFTRPISGH